MSAAVDQLVDLARRARDVVNRLFPRLAITFRRRLPGRFQPYSHTAPDRYPWLFHAARSQIGNPPGLRILSFGCSRGDEVFALQRYFPTAELRGIDIDPLNIATCRARARAQAQTQTRTSFEAAATLDGEPAEAYDAIFCLAVLCHGDLTVRGARSCEPLMRFDDFEATVAGFARCLKPGGLLFLHTTNFRFCDTASARDFDVTFEADAVNMAPDLQFDRNNRLIPGERYRAVAFRKRNQPT